jgi:hypothetical protein
MKSRLLQIAEYSKADGEPVTIDLTKVESVERAGPDKTTITLKANIVTVNEKYTKVKEAWINALTGDL